MRWMNVVMATAVASVVCAPASGQTAMPSASGSVGGLTAKFVDVKGVKARYYEAGQGEPMVLIHGGSTGGSSTANVWSRNIPALSKKFHVFAVDRLGSGLSGNPTDPKDYDTPGQVEFIYQFIQALKLNHIHLVGHSAGGAVALYTAINHPEMFKTLVIVAEGPENPSAGNGPTRLEPALKKCPDQNVYEGLKCRVEALAWLPTTFDDEYWKADVYMATLPKSKEARAAVAARAGDPQRAKDSAAYREQMWDRVRRDGVLQMPVLIYSGKNDVLDWSVADPTAMLRGELGLFDILATKNTRVQMNIINQGGHFMYREHPEEFNRDLIAFIDYWNAHPAPTGAPTTPSR